MGKGTTVLSGVATNGRTFRSSMLAGIGYLLASFAGDFWVLALLLAIAGMGDAAWHPMATGVLVQHFPGRRGEALGVHAMGGTLAEVVGPLTAGFLLGFLDWRGALQVSVVPTLLMGIGFIWMRPTEVLLQPTGSLWSRPT